MEQYLALTPGNQAPGVVKPEIKGNVNFEIKRPPRYYTRVDNRPPFGENKPSLKEIMNKRLEELTRRRKEMEVWIKKLQESTNLNTRNQNASLKNLETQIEQMSKDYQAKAANEVSKETKEGLPRVLTCQLPLKEMNPRSFTLSCIIGSLNLFTMADLGASVNIKPRSMNSGKCSGEIDKALFPFDFMIIDMIGDPNETMILGRPFLSTIHARIDILDKEILLGVGEDRIVFDMNGNVHQPVALIEKVCVINEVQEESFNPLEIGDDLFSYDSPLCLEVERINHIFKTNKNHEDTLVYDNMQEQYEGEKRKTTIAESKTTTSRLHYYRIHGLNKRGNIKQWECNLDDEIQNEKGKEMVFLDLLLIKYRNSKIDDKYDEYKAVLDNEIEKLANEYELRIGNKGYILDDIWEKCEQVHGGMLYSWYDDGFKEEERWESGLDEKYYNPP
ncbi:hypothetical protein Tco_0014748 [Tanacetum coccineum]